MWWLIAASGVGMLATLFLLGRRNERAVRRDWELLLTPRGEKVYRTLERRVQTEMDLLALPTDEAIKVHELGSLEDAKRLLDVGFRAIEHFAPNMLRLLGAMATFSRMVSAMAPVRPLDPRDFRLAQIVSLTALGRLLHEFLVATTERFRLRVYILAQSFAIALRFLARSRARIASGQPESEREWEQIKAIRHDIEALTDESLVSLRVLLTSLAAEQKDALFDKLPEG